MKPCLNWTYLTLLVALGCLGQVEPQDGCVPTGPSTNTTNCCNCSANDLLCDDRCPDGYFKDEAYQTWCTSTTTTTAGPITMTSTNITEDVESENSTDTTPKQDVNTFSIKAARTWHVCRRCRQFCATCSQTDSCITCQAEYTRTSSGTNECVKDSSPPENKAGIIAGATAGGVAAIVVVVVIVVCLFRRRPGRRSADGGMMNRDESAEAQPGMIERYNSESDLLSTAEVDKETGGSSVVLVSKGNKTYVRDKHHKSNYQNAPRNKLTVSTIQQGHDKVLRYTRDPTATRAATLPRNNTEEKELEELGDAPLPPNSGGFFDDAESRSDQSGRQHLPLPPLPGENWPLSGQQRTHTAVRSGHTSKEDDDPEADYQNLTLQTTAGSKTSGSRRSRPSKPDQKDENDDDDDSPDESYENVGAKAKLTDRKPKGGNHHGGLVNQAAKVDNDEEPQEVYGNQDVIVEHKSQASGAATYMRMDLGKTNYPDDDPDNQPTYSNDNDEHLYANFPSGPKARK